MTVRGKRTLTIVAAAVLTLALGTAGFSYADNAFTTDLTVADEGAVAQDAAVVAASEGSEIAGSSEGDYAGPMIDLFGDDDDETEAEETEKSHYWIELRDKSTEPRLVGDKGAALTVRICGTNANREQLPEVTWTSSDPDIVSVDKNGEMHYNAAGTATITATFYGATASADITVKEANFRVARANGQTFRTNELYYDFNDDATITMLNDYTLTFPSRLGAQPYIVYNLHVTLDLGGHTLTISPESGLYGLLVVNYNTLTIKNGTINIQTPDDRAIAGMSIASSGLILEDSVTANAFGSASVVKLGSMSTSTLNSSAKLTSESAPAVRADSVKNSRLYENQVTIAKGSVESARAAAIQFDGQGALSLGDAKVKGSPAIAMNNGTMNADKGDIEGVEDAGILVAAPATVNIADGVTVAGAPSLKIADVAAYGEEKAAVTIKGGQFSDDAGNGEGFVLPEGKELTRIEGKPFFTLDDKKPDWLKWEERDEQKKNESFSCEPAVRFDGSMFVCSLGMHGLEIEADGRGWEDYTVEAWHGDDKAGFRTDYPMGGDCSQVCPLPVAPKDVLETVHYRVYYKGGAEPLAAVDTTIDAIMKASASRAGKGEDAIRPMVELCESAHVYGTLLSHYSDKVKGGEADAAGDEALKAKLAEVVVPEGEAPKVNGGSSPIKLTSASLTFGDKATVNFCFTPIDGYAASDIETIVDGVVVSDGKKGTNKATGARVARRVLDDGRLCLSISDIDPACFDHRFAVCAGFGTNVKQLDYSVLSYLYLNQKVEGLGDICKALYSYYLAVRAA